MAGRSRGTRSPTRGEDGAAERTRPALEPEVIEPGADSDAESGAYEPGLIPVPSEERSRATRPTGRAIPTGTSATFIVGSDSQAVPTGPVVDVGTTPSLPVPRGTDSVARIGPQQAILRQVGRFPLLSAGEEPAL